MKIRIIAGILALSLTSLLRADLAEALDGSTGNIYRIDPAARSFEYVREIGYDPKDNPGRNRFTASWSADTRVTRVEEKTSFSGIEGPVVAKFEGIDDANAGALGEGKAFVARVATVFPGAGEDMISGRDGQNRSVVGWFTPDKSRDPRGGTIRIGDRQVPVSLRPRNSRLFIHEPLTPAGLAGGFWKATLHGAEKDGRFVVAGMEVSALPDPRKTDDPKLPRVLVIGDSISMNYDEAAREALKGVANYHRNEGNASSSLHGVNNAELWLGEYQEPGLHWDVIQFNHGLHDLKQAYDRASDTFGEYSIPLADYKANLEKEIGLLQKTGATLIWCSTTPVPNDNKGQYARRKGAAREFNAAALEVMKRHPDILVNDLYSVVNDSPLFDDWRGQNDVHFYKDEQRKALGEAVAKEIRKALEAR